MQQVRQSYWIFQILGWSLYLGAETLLSFLVFPFNPDKWSVIVYNNFLMATIGIGLTHVFRVIYRNGGWDAEMRYGLVVLRLVVSVLTMALLMAFVQTSLETDNTIIKNYSLIIRELGYVIYYSKPLLMWVLIYIFYVYADKNQQEKIKRIELEANIATSEVRILRSQINPHFTFNALNSIRALIFEDPKRAVISITKLSNLLRNSLVADRKSIIPLEEELKTVEDYLALEKIRYENRLQYKFDLAPESLKQSVPPMMIQTLVENAIKHGVQKAVNWGFVAIETLVQNNFFIIIIKNTGTLPDTYTPEEVKGFGIENTEKRLKLIFGENAGIQLYQKDSETVYAKVKIPL